MYKELGISERVVDLVEQVEKEVKTVFADIDKVCEYNSSKVLSAFQKNQISDLHFNQTTGYGYGDIGRDTCERVFADVLRAEDCLVRGQFISGTHALTVALFALLRPGDTMLSITGKPYDTLDEVIGIVDNPSSLKSYNVNFEQIELVDDEFDYEKIEERLKKGNVKLIEIQRSRGYSTRKSIKIEQVEKVIEHIRKFDENVIIMIDNCYCEFVDTREPTEVGADIIVRVINKKLGRWNCTKWRIHCRTSRFSKTSSRKINCTRRRKRSRTIAWHYKSNIAGIVLCTISSSKQLEDSSFCKQNARKIRI